jgi:hypothetical protein
MTIAGQYHNITGYHEANNMQVLVAEQVIMAHSKTQCTSGSIQVLHIPESNIGNAHVSPETDFRVVAYQGTVGPFVLPNICRQAPIHQEACHVPKHLQHAPFLD